MVFRLEHRTQPVSRSSLGCVDPFSQCCSESQLRHLQHSFLLVYAGRPGWVTGKQVLAPFGKQSTGRFLPLILLLLISTGGEKHTSFNRRKAVLLWSKNRGVTSSHTILGVPFTWTQCGYHSLGRHCVESKER